MKIKEMSKKDGITLIALVITILVLLILAEITIGTVASDNGILQNSVKAKERTEIAEEREIVDTAAVQAMSKNNRGIIEKTKLETELDNLTGEGVTEVTEDTEEGGYFVKFIESGRIYKVDENGNVEYLGQEEELLTKAEITADPERDTTPKLTQEVDLTVKTIIDIGEIDYTLVYAWSKNQDTAPADTEFTVADLEGEGRIRKTTVHSDVSDEGNYYLWVRAVVGEIEQEECFGPYAIKDHAMLVDVNWTSSLSDAGFLGNATVKRALVKSITIKNTLDGHSKDDPNTWDVTDGKKGKYLAWYEGDETNGYEVTIAGEGGVVANSPSAYLFRNIGSGIKNEEVTITGLENLDTGLIEGSIEYMFENCKATSLNLSNFNTSEVTSMSSMFWGCSNLTELDLSNFDTSNVTSMYGMFRDCTKLNTLNISKFNTKNVKSMEMMFYNCSSLTKLDIKNFDTSSVTSMSYMFSSCGATNLDLRNFDTSNVTYTGYMFDSCKATSINVSSFDTSNVKSMRGMFSSCSAPNLDLSNFDTSNVTDMWMMFTSCKATKLDLSNFDTSKVTTMYRMFLWCNASEIDVSNFDTSNVTTMSLMFKECKSLTQLDLSSFKTPKVKYMDDMFASCTSLKEIDFSNFEAADGLNVAQMFYNCPSLEKLDIRKFDIANTTGYNYFWFYMPPTNCSIIVKNEDMRQWFAENLPKYTNVTIGA